MTMRGIDISDYQRGLDLTKIDYDFVFCKATEGIDKIHSTCDPFIQMAISQKKLYGFYHFLDKSDPVKQAEFFYSNCKNYFGCGIPMLDYEAYGRIGTDKAKLFLDRIYELTGVRCIVYMSRSVTTEEDWSQIAKNHALWVAQYADSNDTGYQDSPWLPEGSFGAWSSCIIHQYSSHGRLNGYDKYLDLDIAYMDKQAWFKYVHGERAGNASAAEVCPVGTVLDLAVKVMRGKYGNGDERKAKLGARFNEVQALINRVATASADDLAADVLNGKLGNGETRKVILGNRYDEVQAVVNSRVNAVDIDALAHAVIRGEYGNGDERKAKLGANFDAVQKRVNELL